MRIGIGLAVSGGPSTLAALVKEAQRAEEAGFASIWLSNIFSFDALTVLALAGKETHRVELGTFVVPTYPRHPAALAQQALTVQAATNGRLALGIGLSHQVVIENMFGLDYSKPIPHTKEYLTILNGLLAQEPVKFTGELYRVAAQLNVPGATKPTLLVAALGPAMLRLSGRLADGTATWMGRAQLPARRRRANDHGSGVEGGKAGPARRSRSAGMCHRRRGSGPRDRGQDVRGLRPASFVPRHVGPRRGRRSGGCGNCRDGRRGREADRGVRRRGHHRLQRRHLRPARRRSFPYVRAAL